jgi:cation diffusion facilitator CzcD-associated flavoprotein CzcO
MQILRAIQPLVKHLTVVIRQPAWIFGAFGEAQRPYSPEEIKNFKDNPQHLTAKRKQFESRVNSYFGFCLKDSPQQAQIRTHLTKELEKKIKEADSGKLDERSIVPDYAVGCRRPTPGVGYLEALNAPNVSLVVGEVRKATKAGFVDDRDVEHEADVLVCATGFDTSHLPRFSLRGTGGKDLRDEWRERPTAYLALAVPDMPNYFVFYGPNNPFGSGAFLITIGKATA